MKICKKCQNNIPSSFVDIDGQRKSLTSRDYCLECNPYNSRRQNRAWSTKNSASTTLDSIENIAEKITNSQSMAEFLRWYNLPINSGSTAKVLKTFIKENNIPTPNWKGHGWSKNQKLKDWKDFTKTSALKIHLLKLKGRQCEKCKRKQWCNQPIHLEVHHMDHNHDNNELTNLQLLCPNCHFHYHKSHRKNKRRQCH